MFDLRSVRQSSKISVIRDKMTDSKALQLLQKIEKQAEVGEIMHAEQTALNIMDIERTKEEAIKFRFMVGYVIFSVIMFVAGNVYVQRYKYPGHFEWWSKHNRIIPDGKGGIQQLETAEKGKGKSQYSMYQVVIAALYPSMQSFLETFAIYESLPSNGAKFLMNAVHHFNRNSKTRGKLTVYHWAGGPHQTHASELFKCPGGWLSGGNNKDLSKNERRNLVRKNWMASKGKNLWYDFFPDPAIYSTSFFSVPIIQNMVENYETCKGNAEAFSGLYALYDGGLCAVAASATSSSSAANLFAHYFGSPGNYKPSCKGAAAQGALNGGLMTGMSSMGMMDMAGVVQVGGSTAFMGGVAAVSIIGGIAGAVIGGEAAKEKCEESGGRPEAR